MNRLALAAHNGLHLELKSILETGDVCCDSRFSNDRTALHFASSRSHLECARLLLVHGADVDARDCDGWTPLWFSVIQGDFQMCELLINASANLDVVDQQGHSPICSALIFSKHQIVNLLLQKGASFDRHIQGENLLWFCVKNGMSGDARSLLEAGADPNIRDTVYNFTPLIYAAKHGYHAMSQVLINHGADMQAREATIGNALNASVASESLQLVQKMLHLGLHPDSRDEMGVTCLMRSASSGDVAMINILLEHGANPNIVDKINRSAIEQMEMAEVIGLEGNYLACRQKLNHYIAIWAKGPPSLTDLCVFSIKRQRLYYNEETLVDTVPDAMVAEYFSDWSGAEKWISEWTNVD